ncbi:MAG: glycosyl hydrolase family 28 protein [Candidatus Cryptobacteroides sp.]
MFRFGRHIFTLAAAGLILAACRQSELPSRETPDGSYEVVVEGIPEDVDTWDYIVYAFKDEECTDVAVGSSERPASVLVPGVRMNVIASDEMDKFVIGAKTEALPLSSYFFYPKDTASEMPRLWFWEGNSSQPYTSAVPLSLFTPSFTMTLTDAPVTFVSASSTVSALADRISLPGWTPSVKDKGWSKTFEVTREKPQADSYLMPMYEDGGWILPVNLTIDGLETDRIDIPVTKPLEKGCALSLELDFSKFETDGLLACWVRMSYASSSEPVLWGKTVQLKEVLKKNTHYQVSVQQVDGQWKDAFVHDALVSDAPNHHPQIWNDWNNSKKLRDTSSFANFTADFTSPVKVRVTKLGGSFSSVKVRPSQYGISPVRIDEKTIEFTIPSYGMRKLSVEYDSDRFHNLHILPEKPDPERPDPDNLPSDMIYYGPGVWNPEWITLRDNQTLYIDEGAVVYAKINSIGDNTAIKGRGVLSGERLAHTGNVYASGYQMIETNATKSGTRNGFTVEGITVVDSPSWTFSIYRTNNVRIENTNIICWILNGDGIDLCSVDGGIIKGCFIRTYDDCITLKVNHLSLDDTKNILIQDNLIWADYAGGIVVGPESGTTGGGRIHDVEVCGCTVLDYPTQNSNYASDDRGGLCVSQYPSGGTTSGTISDISFHDIVIDNIRPGGRPISVWQKPSQEGCLMERVYFKDISILAETECGISTVVSNGNSIKDLSFNNVTYNGVLIQNSGKWLVSDDDIQITY